MPCPLGNAPVPIVAWAEAVTDGNEPITALRKFRPFLISARRVGHAVGHWLSAFQPPPSMTNVTITFGRLAGVRRPGSGSPSRAGKSNPMSDAAEGARSASDTGSTRSCGETMPGAYSSSGTRSVYPQAMAWLLRGSFRDRARDSLE